MSTLGLIQSPGMTDIELALTLRNRGWQGGHIAEFSGEKGITAFFAPNGRVIAKVIYDNQTGSKIAIFLTED